MDLIVCADRVGPSLKRTPASPPSGCARAGSPRSAREPTWPAGGVRRPGSSTSGPRTLTPGLIDSHIHPVLGAKLTRGVGLLGMDLDGVRRALAEHAATLEPDAWVLGWGLEPQRGAREEPGRRRHRRGRRRAAGPDQALRRPLGARVDGGAPGRRLDGPRVFDERSEVVCDPNGRPTGLLLESARDRARGQRGPTGRPSSRSPSALTPRWRGWRRSGITTGHALEHAPEASAVYELIEAEHDLPVRLRCSPWVQPGTGETDWAAVAALQGTGGRRWQVRGAKLFIDGTVDNGTAWLAEPDSLGQSTAPFWPDPASYSRAIAWFDRP